MEQYFYSSLSQAQVQWAILKELVIRDIANMHRQQERENTG